MVPSTTSMRQVKRTAAIAWSPPSQTSPLLATGTLAGAMDASFSTLAELEIYDLKLDDRSGEPVLKTSISTPSSESALLKRCEAHHGAVRGLQVNPFQPFLVASGATDAEIWLWDLNNLNQPYSPSASKSSRLEDITDLAWNRLVPHILAASSNSGYTVVWDLKSRKEVLQLSANGNRLSTSAIAWNPENATQILTATDDDQDPIIYSWDLRNARAPEKTLKGHSKGILSMAWCPKDAELLLSCGKDNKSICWNPKTGAVIADLTRSDNWLFDVQWCPRNPDIFSTCSFSGNVAISSFQSIVSGGSRSATTSATAEDFFASAASGIAHRPAAPAHVQIPKWLRRPIGISFGFGGRLVTFSSLKSENSRVVSVVSIAVVSQKLVKESKKLDAALSTQSLAEYCTEKIPTTIPNLHVNDADAVFWNVAKVMFESNPQERLMNLLGFDTKQLEETIRLLSLQEESAHNTANITTLSQMASMPTSSAVSPAEDDSKFDEFFSGAGPEGGSQFDFGSLVTQAPESLGALALPESTVSRTSHQRRGTFQGAPFSLFSAESSEIDRTITRAIILGNFEGAVDLCVKADRLSDALLVAICGGNELVARTQQLYFQKARFPYLRVVSGIVKNDISDVVEHAYIENWEEILALICSYAKGATFTQLCFLLGCRIESAVHANPAMATPALICFMAAGNAAKAISLIISRQLPSAPSRSNSAEYAEWLESIVEKTRVLEQVSGYIAPHDAVAVQEALPAISDHFIEYSYIMANNGLLDVAIRYFNSFSQNRTLNGEEDAVTVFGDRLAKATHSLGIPMRSVPDPFPAGSVDIVPEVGHVPETAQSRTQPLASHQSFHHQNATQVHPPHRNSFGHGPALPVPGSGMHSATPMSIAPTAHHYSQSTSVPGPSSSSFAPPPPTLSSASSTYAPLHPAGGGGSSYGAAPQIPQPQPMIPPLPAMGNQSFGALSPSHIPPMPGTGAHQTLTPLAPGANPFAAAPPQSQPVPQTQSYVAPSITASASHFTGSQSIHSPRVPGPPVGFTPSVPSYASSTQSTIPAPIASFPSQSMSPTHLAPPARPSLVPEPPRVVAPAVETPQPRRSPAGAFNDPPMVPPRAPVAQQHQQPHPTMMQPTSPTHAVGTVSASVAAVSPPAVAPKSPVGPVDPSKIPSNMLPIYQAFNTLISQCQERALPMQRRIVEDSARRMQALFAQLVSNELSPTTLQLVSEMAACITSGQYERAFELHTPLMTSYFAETGAWILAAKRLIEVAKMCLR